MTLLAIAAFAAALLASAPPAGAAPHPITAAGPEGALAGTIVPPAAGRPVVLVVPGSGPTDRDGNNPMGVAAAPYRMLAEELAARGIGSVRIDKRGMFASKAAVADPNAVTIGGYVDDVAAWIASIRKDTGRECVWLLGHSEGGLIALAAAGKVDRVCGVILVAAPGRPMGQILREQLQANPANAPVLPDAMAAIAKLESGERVDVAAMHPALQGLFAPAVQGFLIDMFRYDPAALAAKIDRPILIVQGGRDLQVPVADGEALHAAQPAARYVPVPDMNHVLKTVTADDRAANFATYADPALPVAPALVDAIAAFVGGTS
jgi:pimeloyl-ACP methyl ester carboxylesterase